MEQTNFKRFQKIYKILASIIVFGFLSINVCLAKCEVKSPILQNEITIKAAQQGKTNAKEQIKSELICEVSKYISSRTKKANAFIPKYIVNAALEHNIDICFMLAQTQIETTFGTAGAGRESSRRSLFGVAVRRYSNYEAAVNDYCKLLKKSYLVKGRTEKHLMAKYVTGSGARYAGNPKYEVELTNAYNVIKRKTNIYKLQQDYKNTL